MRQNYLFNELSINHGRLLETPERVEFISRLYFLTLFIRLTV